MLVLSVMILKLLNKISLYLDLLYSILHQQSVKRKHHEQFHMKRKGNE
jgi:hypothetical protein